MIASRENLSPLACAGNLIASQTRRSFRRCQAEQSEATLSLWAIVIRRFVPGLHSTREDALVTAGQSRQDSAGQLSRVSNLSVQIHLTASFVEGGRPLRSADSQVPINREGPIFGQSGLCSKPPMSSAIPTSFGRQPFAPASS